MALRNARAHLRCAPNVVVRRQKYIPALPTWMLNASNGFGGVQVDGSAPALLAGPILGEERADLGLAARSLSAALRAGFGFGLCFGLALAAALGSRARRALLVSARACLRNSLSWE